VNLIWRIASPNLSTGIGAATAGLVSRMIKDDHKVMVIHHDGEHPLMMINGIPT
jgi:hypothetical protein